MSANVSSQTPAHDDPRENRGDPTSWKDSVGAAASHAADAAKVIRDATQTVAAKAGTAASGLGDAGSELATSARDHAKTFASELEAMARRNPLGTIAGAVLVGVVIGMMSSRGRS
jgi:ElaB/YqjD/DUF883 family membrane-anchored ribosome-binding protein